METYKLETLGGENFSDVMNKAYAIACNKNVTVEFDFNAIQCFVNQSTILHWFKRDYFNAHLMEWKTIGPVCRAYSDSTEAEIKRREIQRDEGIEKSRREQEQKDNHERKLYEEKTEGVEIEIKDKEAWSEIKRVNESPYGKACVDYAEAWAKLMQVEISRGVEINACADKTSYELGFFGITGFMYGMAVRILSKCWKHGEELRVWHNKKYKHEGDGVVNPAVLKVSVSK